VTGDRRAYLASFRAAAATAVVVAAATVLCWYALPIARRLQGW